MTRAEKLLEAFRGILSSDADRRTEAMNFVMEIKEHSPLEGLCACAEILLVDGCSVPDYQSAIVYMNQILESPTGVDTGTWCRFSREAEEQRSKVINATLKSLMFPDERIWATAAMVIGQLQQRERGNCMVTLEPMWRVLQENSSNPVVCFAVVQAFKYSFMAIAREIKADRHTSKYGAPVQKLFEAFVQNAVDTIGNAPTKHPMIVRGALEALTEFLPLKMYYTFDEFQGQLFVRVGEILKACDNFELFRAGIQFYYRFIEEYYESESLVVEPIALITSEFFGHPNMRFSSYAFEFWNQVIKFEKARRDRNKLIDDYKTCKMAHSVTQTDKATECKMARCYVRGIVKQYQNPLIESALQAMTKLSPDDVMAEDKDDFDGEAIHVFATSLLSRLFNVDPQAVVGSIDRCWSAGFEDKPWTVKHALILMLDAICGPVHLRPVGEFIASKTGPLLDAARSDVARLSETALWVIGSAIKEYGIFVNPEQVSAILDIVMDCISRGSEIVTETALRAVSSIIERFNRQAAESPLLSLIEPITRIVDSVIQNPTPRLVQRAFEVKEALVEHLPMGKPEPVVQLVDQTLSTIGDGRLLGDQLSLLGTCFKYFCPALKEKVAPVASLMFTCLRAKNNYFEDALKAMMVVVTALGPDAGGLVDDLMPIVGEAIDMNTPSITVTTVHLLGNLFAAVGPAADAHLKPTVQLINNLFNNSSFMLNNKHQYPIIALALGKIMKGVSYIQDATLRDHLMSLYQRLLQEAAINKANDEEVKFANLLYECVFAGYGAIIKTSASDVDFLSSRASFLFEPVTKLLLLPHRTTGALFGFCEFYQTALETMSAIPRCRIVLKRSHNLSLLLWAECAGDPDLTRLARRIFDALQT